MIASFFLSLREGLEAALIIGVLLGALSKLERPDFRSSIWMGTGLAIGVSIVVGTVLNVIGASFEGRAEEIFEGVAMLSAAVILTWAILWMQSQARSVSKQLESDVHKAVLKGSKTALLSLAFLAVIREGVELALFLLAVQQTTSPLQTLSGALLG